jgi:Undecaprenyl-phosphate glucose phosphotransferase
VLGKPTSIGRVIRVTAADEVIIALSGRSSGEVLDIVALAEDEAVEIKLYPDVFQLVTNNEVSVGDVSGLPLLSVKNVALDSPINQALKRTLDVVVAAIVMTLFSPIMLLIAALIRLESPGPVFFVQERVGLDGRPFPCIKFRGMRQDAEAMGSWTTQDDPRVTRLGAFLRRYSLDELPQFMNVLRGEMSIVGPRPEQPMWVEKFSQSIPRYVRRHKQKAGITGWAQVNGLRGDTSIEERTRYDLYYIENWSLLFDVKIIIKTAARTLTGKLQGY